MPNKILRTILGAMGAAALLGLPIASSAPAAPPPLYVAAGAGGNCTSANPCGSIDAAVGRASSGTVIEMRAGSYGDQVISANKLSTIGFAQNIIVRPASGATVRVAGVDVYTPRVTVRGLVSTGTISIKPGAHFVRFEDMTTNGASVYITAADNTAITGSRIRPSDDKDGIQVKGRDDDNPNGVLLDGNVVGPGIRASAGAHVDCLQLLGGTNVTVRGNTLFDCSNAAIQLGNMPGSTVGTVRVERNFLRECTPRTSTCNGYHAMIMGSKNADDVTLLHNSIVGSVAVAGTNSYSGFRAKGNIATSLPCTANVNNNLVAADRCGPADRRGAAIFVNRLGAIPDLHLTADSLGIDVGSGADSLGIDVRSADAVWPDVDGTNGVCGGAVDLGADERCVGDTTTPQPSTTTTPPTTTPPTTTPPTTTTPVSPDPVFAFPPAPSGMVTDQLVVKLHSKRQSHDFVLAIGQGMTTISATHSPFSGVTKGNLKLELIAFDGTVVATASGNFSASLSTPLFRGFYVLRVSSRPGTVRIAVTHPLV